MDDLADGDDVVMVKRAQILDLSQRREWEALI